MAISSPELEPFNPVDKKNLAEGIVRRISLHPAHKMPPESRFEGAGVYVLYYVGKLAPYSNVASRNRAAKFERPIYVGKADPKGTRKGSELDPKPGAALYERLKTHADRIKATQNLSLEDFYFRIVILDHVWIRLGEAGLIDHYRPLWNALLDGFGSKVPGKNRQSQQRSAWDTMHPGVGWPELLSDGKHKEASLIEAIKEFFKEHP